MYVYIHVVNTSYNDTNAHKLNLELDALKAQRSKGCGLGCDRPMETGRSAKEAFVSGHSGTSFTEVYLVLSTCCFGVLLRHVGLLCQETIRARHRQSYLYGCLCDYIETVCSYVCIVCVWMDGWRVSFKRKYYFRTQWLTKNLWCRLAEQGVIRGRGIS